MKRWLLLSSALVLSGCNAILDIPERPLAEGPDDTGSTASDAKADSSVTPPDAGDTGLADTTLDDSASDSGSDSALDSTPDGTVLDTSTPDTTVVDTSTPDTTVADTSSVDTAVGDTAVTADTGASDTGVINDTSVADTGAVDTGAVDTGAVDTGPTCGLTGQPCCGIASKTTCNTGAVCDATSGMCVAATPACVRASDCTPDGKVCGGPSTCSGLLCYQCITTFGSKNAFEPCTSGAQCLTGICDILRNVCTSPCANAITNDADCTSLGANVACTELSVTLSAGDAAVATNRIGYCARKCKRDGDCTAGEYCRSATNLAQNRVDITCSPPRTTGSKLVGETCTSSNECRGGNCINTGTLGLRCSNFCNGAADCMGTLPTCGLVNLTLPMGSGSQPANMCLP